MSITNQTGFPLLVQDVLVQWNHDAGHALGADKTLRLVEAKLDDNVFMSDTTGVYAPSFNITPSGLSIPTGTSTITFTFHQSYTRTDSTERILINLATNGCQTYPIDSDSAAATHTPTIMPTDTPTYTPTNTPTDTPTSTPTPTSTNTVTATPTYTPTQAHTPTATPAATALILQPSGSAGNDIYIFSAAATTNYGTSTEMGIGEANVATNIIGRSLLKFDLSSIPANATITSVTLSLWPNTDYSSNTRTIRVYRLKVPFNESQATWNTRATGSNWQTAGASGVNDRESLAIGSVQILANEPLNTEKQISLSPAQIQELIDGTFTNNGFIIIADTELNDGFTYKTSDHATASQRPRLVIQYTVP